jgi:hypothetical protein
MTHCLKIFTSSYVDIAEGRKRFEIRFNDRGYKVGDILFLSPIDKKGSFVIGLPSIKCRIIYTDHYEQKSGYIVLGFDKLITDEDLELDL